MRINELGEFGIIDLISRMVVQERSGLDHGSLFPVQLIVDVGDDTAAWRTADTTELFTTDTMVEGVHFASDLIHWRDLGWKSIASNVSDIAAMGGLPLYALVTLGLPPDTELEDLKELYRGLLDLGNKYGVSIVGGDTVRSPVVFISVSLIGVHPGQPMLRSTARPGDLVAVTGYMGNSGGGLRVAMDSAPISEVAADYLRRAHTRPEPAVAEGRVLADAGVITAIDISDGLADDLAKMCQASGTAARIFTDQIPVHHLLKAAFPDQYVELALYSGEDYHLLFTAGRRLMSKIMPLLPVAAAVVGEVIKGESGQVVIVDTAGVETVDCRGGWDHFI